MTRANTPKPKGAHGMSRPAAGGEHTDALEHGMPHDTRNPSAGTAHAGVGVKPSSSENHLEKGDFPEPGQETSGGGAHNHRGLPPPSKESAGGVNAQRATGDGRGSSGKFRGTMGGGAMGEPKYKGTMGG